MKSMNVLTKQALKAREHAYAPYSNFKVGAALLLENGEIVEGCNVENSSYGLAICAERTAVCKAVSQGKRNFKAIAIAADSSPLASPCGACRQFLAEFAPDLPVFLVNLDGENRETSLDKLLPEQFRFNKR